MKTVDIFEDENSIIIDDKYDTTDFTFYPEEKKFDVSRSIKDDCFYNNQTIQYKISTNPIEIEMRTLESSHEPPLEYSIKDGVVLESELKKRDMLFPDRIESLKKEVEWSKVSIFGNYEVNLFILSRHPEIISKEEYRRFLRQSLERMKVGVSKIEEAVKSDSRGLQFHNSEYGKSIWYAETDEAKKESEEYWKLPEEKRGASDYGKKLAYVEKFNDSLFKETSPSYVGISDYEFRSSDEIVSYIEKLLNQKEKIVTKKENILPQQNNSNNKVFNIVIYLLTAFFIILKLTDGVDWSWWAVLSPFLLWEGLGFLLGVLRALAK